MKALWEIRINFFKFKKMLNIAVLNCEAKIRNTVNIIGREFTLTTLVYGFSLKLFKNRRAYPSLVFKPIEHKTINTNQILGE